MLMLHQLRFLLQSATAVAVKTIRSPPTSRQNLISPIRQVAPCSYLPETCYLHLQIIQI